MKNSNKNRVNCSHIGTLLAANHAKFNLKELDREAIELLSNIHQ